MWSMYSVYVTKKQVQNLPLYLIITLEGIIMEFQRWLLTNKVEIYHFTKDTDSIAYLMFEGTFSKARQEFGDSIFDDDFEPKNNHFIIKCATLKGFTDVDRKEILSFCDKILGFKPSIDYLVDFFSIEKEIEFSYPQDFGFKEMINQFNKTFQINIVLSDYQSFNTLVQRYLL